MFSQQGESSKLTHSLFRYPAKFHPPVAATLLEKYSRPHETVLDPFCGSGTLLVEAAKLGRFGIGMDIDPVAVAVSVAKTALIDPLEAQDYYTRVRKRVEDDCAAPLSYDDLKWDDWTVEQFDTVVQQESLWVPEIPNIRHWFRNYVIADLSRILAILADEEAAPEIVHFFRVVFASVIRNVSNADPVPVSGLEVTSHMRRKDEAGRVINPPVLFHKAATKALVGLEDYMRIASTPQVVMEGDAVSMASKLAEPVDVIITSPPYNSAVDYYRRHQLEMFWLGLVDTHEQRLSLLPKYVGKHRVAMSHPHLKLPWDPGPMTERLELTMRQQSPQRANDFRAYIAAMSIWFSEACRTLRQGGTAALVVGQSQWDGRPIETELLMAEAAGPWFEVVEVLSYPVRNRYMSYTRRNGADIDTELVLELRRADSC